MDATISWAGLSIPPAPPSQDGQNRMAVTSPHRTSEMERDGPLQRATRGAGTRTDEKLLLPPLLRRDEAGTPSPAVAPSCERDGPLQRATRGGGSGPTKDSSS